MINVYNYENLREEIATFINSQINCNYKLEYSAIELNINQLILKSDGFEIIIEFDESINKFKFSFKHNVSYLGTINKYLDYDKADLFDFVLKMNEYFIDAYNSKNNFLEFFRTIYINYSNNFKEELFSYIRNSYKKREAYKSTWYINAIVIKEHTYYETSRIGKDTKLKTIDQYKIKLNYASLSYTSIDNHPKDLLDKINVLLENELILEDVDLDFSGGSASSVFINETSENYNFLLSRLINQNFHLIDSELNLNNNFNQFLKIIKDQFKKILSPLDYLKIDTNHTSNGYSKRSLVNLLLKENAYSKIVYTFIMLITDKKYKFSTTNLYIWEYISLIILDKTSSFKSITQFKNNMNIDIIIFYEIYKLYLENKSSVDMQSIFADTIDSQNINDTIQSYILNAPNLNLSLLKSYAFKETFFY